MAQGRASAIWGDLKMSLYTRLMQTGDTSTWISAHTFMAVMQEFMLGNIDVTEASTYFGLSSGEQTEAAALRDKILAETNANATVQSVMRRLKAVEIENVIIASQN